MRANSVGEEQSKREGKGFESEKSGARGVGTREEKKGLVKQRTEFLLS